MKNPSLILLALLLGGCASEYRFTSNLDSEAINEYFKVGDVELYQGDHQPNTSYELKGLVEGQSCQERDNDMPASISDARTKARKAAAELGANGLIVKRCVLFEESSNACITQALCLGQAILTTEPPKN
ncbi:hypothetical protein LZP69_03115 [Shewanella sp. AS1]|uniref:Rcs stress response system protein RcsF n=1 Tax=Shewanella sp. AS1 TaxID=2907626 RepID=UPI001F1E8133|nr:Rcs stress response system protein RcsF [Shewanella sp. AS1]MCE9678187.1 hypothetical protein [Shewanella sp. AS1]